MGDVSSRVGINIKYYKSYDLFINIEQIHWKTESQWRSKY